VTSESERVDSEETAGSTMPGAIVPSSGSHSKDDAAGNESVRGRGFREKNWMLGSEMGLESLIHVGKVS
jgi:hypothetical protein